MIIWTILCSWKMFDFLPPLHWMFDSHTTISDTTVWHIEEETHVVFEFSWKMLKNYIYI